MVPTKVTSAASMRAPPNGGLSGAVLIQAVDCLDQADATCPCCPGARRLGNPPSVTFSRLPRWLFGQSFVGPVAGELVESLADVRREIGGNIPQVLQ